MSIKYTGNGSLLFLFSIIKGSDHSHIPFVQGFIVGPTAKPSFLLFLLFIITLFNKNDFPVLYLPTKLIIPIFLFFSGFDIIFLASLLIINFLLFRYML